MWFYLSFLLWGEANVSRDNHSTVSKKGVCTKTLFLSVSFSPFYLTSLAAPSLSSVTCLTCALLSPRSRLESCWPKSMKGAQLMQPIHSFYRAKQDDIFSCPGALSANISTRTHHKNTAYLACIINILKTILKNVNQCAWSSDVGCSDRAATVVSTGLKHSPTAPGPSGPSLCWSLLCEISLPLTQKHTVRAIIQKYWVFRFHRKGSAITITYWTLLWVYFSLKSTNNVDQGS